MISLSDYNKNARPPKKVSFQFRFKNIQRLGVPNFEW